MGSLEQSFGRSGKGPEDVPGAEEREFPITYPEIAGFSKDETEAIYDGRHEDALKRFAEMPAGERNEAIIRFVDGIGRANYALSDMIEAAARAEDEDKDERIAAYAAANKRLSAFLDALLRQYEKDGLPPRSVN